MPYVAILPSIYHPFTIHLPIFSVSRNILMMQSVNDVNLAKFLDFDAPLTGTGGEAEIRQWDATYIMNKHNPHIINDMSYSQNLG